MRKRERAAQLKTKQRPDQKSNILVKDRMVKLPLVTATGKIRDGIVKNVGKISEDKRMNPSADTTAFEREIDQVVYKLCRRLDSSSGGEQIAINLGPLMLAERVVMQLSWETPIFPVTNALQ